jgi:hypothetical protein
MGLFVGTWKNAQYCRNAIGLRNGNIAYRQLTCPDHPRCALIKVRVSLFLRRALRVWLTAGCSPGSPAGVTFRDLPPQRWRMAPKSLVALSYGHSFSSFANPAPTAGVPTPSIGPALQRGLLAFPYRVPAFGQDTLHANADPNRRTRSDALDAVQLMRERELACARCCRANRRQR